VFYAIINNQVEKEVSNMQLALAPAGNGNNNNNIPEAVRLFGGMETSTIEMILFPQANVSFNKNQGFVVEHDRSGKNRLLFMAPFISEQRC